MKTNLLVSLDRRQCISHYMPTQGASRQKPTYTTATGKRSQHTVAYKDSKNSIFVAESGALFCRTVEEIFTSVHWQLAPVFVDNIVGFSKSAVVYVSQMRLTLWLLNNASFTLTLEKCKFFAEAKSYLIYNIRSVRCTLTGNNTDAVTNA